jgi:hypothetical protein
MSDRHVSWSNLQKLIESGAPARFRIPGNPVLDVMIESGASGLSLMIHKSLVKVLPAVNLESIRIETIRIDSEDYVRIFTQVRPIYHEFYLFLTEVADSIQVAGEPFDSAVRKRLQSWKELLRSVGLLSAEQQLGLLGELWVLERLMRVHGNKALDSWTGPLAEPHDFRFGSTELEVKTTRSRQRLHVINGLEQLQPSTGMTLYVLSLQMEPADTDDARSLAQAVSSMRNVLSDDAGRKENFERILIQGFAYRAADEQHYGLKFRMRSKPSLILVDSKFPKLTRGILLEFLGAEADHRIQEVRYTVDLDGLGDADGTPAFLKVLPATTPMEGHP